MQNANSSEFSEKQQNFHEQFQSLQDWEQSMLIASLERVAAMLGEDDPTVAAVLDASDLLLEH